MARTWLVLQPFVKRMGVVKTRLNVCGFLPNYLFWREQSLHREMEDDTNAM